MPLHAYAVGPVLFLATPFLTSALNPDFALSRTYLAVSFAQKDRVKALGARWDAVRRKWYVPAGLELAPFQAWLDTTTASSADDGMAVVSSQTSMVLEVPARAVPLSRLLDQVSILVERGFSEPVWVVVEVVNARSHSNGHVYLELSERDADGRVLAKAAGVIWASTAARVLPRFESATGAQLAPGIKLLIQVRPVFKAQYGFSLDVFDIDPDYTLGDLEAQKREIRARLQAEGLFSRNRQLDPPWDYEAVLVLAPQGAAGLGDFRREAERLQQHGVCRFTYVYSRFQGEGAATEMRNALAQALDAWPTASPPDAVVIIRGGGAVNDLAWLNDYALARLVCELPVPVLTGIGHERDSTILDEVANQRFDTPSKAIAGIERIIQLRVDEARRAYDAVYTTAMRAVEAARRITTSLDTQVKQCAQRELAQARTAISQTITHVRMTAVSSLHDAARVSQGLLTEVRHQAHQHVGIANRAVPALVAEIRGESRQALATANMMTSASLASVLDHAKGDLQYARESTLRHHDEVKRLARRSVADARASAQFLWREIAGQGPGKTLQRGFALVRDETGKAITSAATAKQNAHVTIQFRDGDARAEVLDAASVDEPGPLFAQRHP